MLPQPRVSLLEGDALALLSLREAHGAALAYLDPPFAVGIAFGARTTRGQGRALASSTHDGQEIMSGLRAYDDRWGSLDAYLRWLEPRIAASRDLLAPHGTLVLHLDHRAIHEAKLVCDRLFGKRAFRGEIIWLPGNGARGAKGVPSTHQTLLIYANGKDARWSRADPLLREPYATTSLAMHFVQEDEAGRRFRERTINGKSYRYYADEGRALGSVWADCPSMSENTPLRKETTGYPTQKPLRLLERLVVATTEGGETVLDPFAGSGTTLVAAAVRGRHAVGSDTSPLAISTATSRLRARGLDVSVTAAR